MPASSSFATAESIKAQMAAQRAAKEKARAEEDARYEAEMALALAKAEADRLKREIAEKKKADEEKRKREAMRPSIVVKRGQVASSSRVGKRKASVLDVEEEDDELSESSDPGTVEVYDPPCIQCSMRDEVCEKKTNERPGCVRCSVRRVGCSLTRVKKARPSVTTAKKEATISKQAAIEVPGQDDSQLAEEVRRGFDRVVLVMREIRDCLGVIAENVRAKAGVDVGVSAGVVEEKEDEAIEVDELMGGEETVREASVEMTPVASLLPSSAAA